ncbi:MAG: arginase [Nitrospinota bacterium]
MERPSLVQIIGLPIDLGANRRGVDMGPSAIRYAGLQERVSCLGREVRDAGDVAVPVPESRQVGRPHLRYAAEVAAACRELGAKVGAALRGGGFPLVLGGDHSLAMGSVRGAASVRGRLGLLWFDAHGDFNTPDTSPSGNIHGMPLAALAGPPHPELAEIVGSPPPVDPARVALIGVRNLDPAERERFRQAGVHVFTMKEVDRRGMESVVEEGLRTVSAGTEGYHVSFDLDAVDPREAPGVGTPVPGGLSFREAHLAAELVADDGRMLSLDLVEVNPILDERNRTAELAVSLALSLLGTRIL